MNKQRTLRAQVTLAGAGLQTGKSATVVLRAAPVNSGINFIRTDLPHKPLIHIQSFTFDGPVRDRRTTIGFEGALVQTVEHLMAALSALGIDNVVIELNNEELPGMDGSAADYFRELKKAGVVEQDAPRQELIIERPDYILDSECALLVFPDSVFRVSCLISFTQPAIGTQVLSLVVDEKTFETEIAPARTFCLEEQARDLLAKGFGKGATYQNTLVFGADGPVNNTARFPDEPVRHKMLDLIGDLYLVGRRIRGHVVSIKCGHRQNIELVKKLKRLIKDKS